LFWEWESGRQKLRKQAPEDHPRISLQTSDTDRKSITKRIPPEESSRMLVIMFNVLGNFSDQKEIGKKFADSFEVRLSSPKSWQLLSQLSIA
jgi:hypothetical protein